MPIDEFRRSGSPVTEMDIKSMERRMNVTLPPAYRRFLLRTNGGTPHPQEAFAAMGDMDAGSVLAYFYYVTHEKKTYTIDHKHYVFDDRIPSDLVPIAGDVFGNQICIGIDDKNSGQIFFWAMEDEAGPGKKPWRRNIRKIADSMDDFLDSFHVLDEDT